jgi:type II secretory pathway component PulK
MMHDAQRELEPAVERRSTRVTRSRAARSRRGMAILVVIAVFGIVMAICAAWTKSALARLQHQQLAEQKAQATWLAEAGVRRGAALLSADSSYDGESWLVPAAELARLADARVEIEIEPADEPSPGTRITAVATYPAQQPRVRVRKTVTFSLPAEESQP